MTKLSYPTPWDQVAALGPHIARRTRYSVDAFSAAIAGRITPPPQIEGLENLPDDPRFLLVANHYQRKGLWIVHTASVLTQIVRARYGPGDPPVRWIATANFPPLRMLGLRIPSPGDWLLPRVAHALHCYPVAFHGHDSRFTARTMLRLLREAPSLNRPIGLFPEGAAGAAGHLSPALPGVDRLIGMLARAGFALQPVGISETDRFVVRIGPTVPPRQAPDVPVMELIRPLI